VGDAPTDEAPVVPIVIAFVGAAVVIALLFMLILLICCLTPCGLDVIQQLRLRLGLQSDAPLKGHAAVRYLPNMDMASGSVDVIDVEVDTLSPSFNVKQIGGGSRPGSRPGSGRVR